MRWLLGQAEMKINSIRISLWPEGPQREIEGTVHKLISRHHCCLLDACGFSSNAVGEVSVYRRGTGRFCRYVLLLNWMLLKYGSGLPVIHYDSTSLCLDLTICSLGQELSFVAVCIWMTIKNLAMYVRRTGNDFNCLSVSESLETCFCRPSLE